MRLRVIALLVVMTCAGAALGQRNQQVDPLQPGDVVFLGPDASAACAAVSFAGSDPCHVGMLVNATTVTQATSLVEPHAVHSLPLTTFQEEGYRSAMTSYPFAPSAAARETMAAYVAAKAARLSYYDGNHFNQKGGFDGGCDYDVAGCWDGFDYFNEFDCVGLTERAYELAATPDSEGLIPNDDPFNGCTWEGFFFIFPEDQYLSCKTTYAQAHPAVGALTPDTVKHGFWRFYTVRIPSGVTSLTATTTSSTDVDLYWGTLGYLPTPGITECEAESASGNEQCRLDFPSSGLWSVGVYGYANGTSSFTLQITQNGPPSALTGAAGTITATAAQLRGTVTANGLSTTTAFDYGTTAGYGQTTTGQAVSGSTPQTVTANVGGLACNTLYHFRVRASNSGGTAFGGDATFRTGNCPIVFTNDPLVAGVTRVRAIHINELRSGINALRVSAGLTPFVFTGTIASGIAVRASHLLELRAALGQTRAALGLPQLAYTNPLFTSGRIRAVDVMEIRNALR